MPGTQLFNEIYPWNSGFTIDSSYTPGTVVAFFENDATPVRLDSLIATNSDVSDHVVTLFFQDTFGIKALGSATIPAGSGFGPTTPPINVLASLPAAIQGGFALQVATNISVALEAAPTGSSTVGIVAFGGTL